VLHKPDQKLSIDARTYETTRVQEANEFVNDLVARHSLSIVGRSREVNFSARGWNIGDFQVCDFSYGNCETEVKLSPQQEPYCFIAAPLSGHIEVVSGRKQFVVRPGYALAFAGQGNKETSFFDPADSHFLNIRVPYDTLKDFLSAELEIPIKGELYFPDTPIQIDNKLGYMINYLSWLSDNVTASTNQMLVESPHLAQHLRKLLMSLMLSTIEHNFTQRYHKPEGSLPPYYVRQAEEYLSSKAREAITVEEVAQEVNVAPRTLHLGFQRHRNYTITEFLRNERLAIARQELLSAKEKGLSITEIAYSSGFMHLGRFASAYQKRYGEKPSETLRAAPKA